MERDRLHWESVQKNWHATTEADKAHVEMRHKVTNYPRPRFKIMRYYWLIYWHTSCNKVTSGLLRIWPANACLPMRSHACPCVCMVENNRKHSKVMTFFFVFLHEHYMSLLYSWWKRYFFMIFKCFWSFSTMQTHAQACICWSKYTTAILCLILYW